MKSLKMMLGIGVLALGVSSAATTGSYKVKLYDSQLIGQTELKAGEYKVEMQGDKAVFTMGKSTVEVPATMGTNEKKFASDAVTTDGKQIVEIDFGGTTAKMTFGTAVQAAK